MKPYEPVTLQYRDVRSDKIYRVSLEPEGESYHVVFAFGRRGNTFQIGRKTTTPVALEEAGGILERLVASKLAKGYTPLPGGAPFSGTADAGRDSGLRPQLLNPVDEARLQTLLDDTVHVMQQKYDGKRLLLRKADGILIAANRRGLEIPVPAEIALVARDLPGDWVIDGEAVADRLHAFDILESDGRDLRPCRYDERRTALCSLLFRAGLWICPVPTATAPGEKSALFRLLKREGAEGVVFKRIDAPYVPGRPASGGGMLKHKFVESASCIVLAPNPAKRSVALVLYDRGNPIEVGNVTIPPNHPVPTPGAVVEVRYLYAFPGGSLYQSVYLGPRPDIEPEECALDQLKFKREPATN